MNINEFINKTNERVFRPRIVCNDGFSFSARHSKYHYCNDFSMEIGFPNRTEKLLMSHAEDKSDPCNTVYAYVPLDVIQSVINKHNGINITKTFEKEM